MKSVEKEGGLKKKKKKTSLKQFPCHPAIQRLRLVTKYSGTRFLHRLLSCFIIQSTTNFLHLNKISRKYIENTKKKKQRVGFFFGKKLNCYCEAAVSNGKDINCHKINRYLDYFSVQVRLISVFFFCKKGTKQ